MSARLRLKRFATSDAALLAGMADRACVIAASMSSSATAFILRGRPNEQRDLALYRGPGRERRSDLLGGPAQHFLMQLGELTRDRDGAARERLRNILQGFDDAVRAFEEDERCFERCQFREQPFALALLLRHEAREEEAVRRAGRKAQGPSALRKGLGRR